MQVVLPAIQFYHFRFSVSTKTGTNIEPSLVDTLKCLIAALDVIKNFALKFKECY